LGNGTKKINLPMVAYGREMPVVLSQRMPWRASDRPRKHAPGDHAGGQVAAGERQGGEVKNLTLQSEHLAEQHAIMHTPTAGGIAVRLLISAVALIIMIALWISCSGCE
jgi:hypothetical protein